MLEPVLLKIPSVEQVCKRLDQQNLDYLVHLLKLHFLN